MVLPQKSIINAIFFFLSSEENTGLSHKNFLKNFERLHRLPPSSVRSVITKCGPRTSSLSITWELNKSAEYRPYLDLQSWNLYLMNR